MYILHAILSIANCIQVENTGGDLYHLAISIIENYNSHTLDLILLKQTLEKASEFGSIESLTRLGELYFFGFPISPDNPSFESEFIDQHGHFIHDIPKAASYFIEAANYGNTDALFYMSLMFQHNFLISDFETYIKDYSYSDFLKTYNKAADFDSVLLRVSSAISYLKCKNLNENIFELISNIALTDFLETPFNSFNCPAECDEFAIYAYTVAEQVINHINKIGTDEKDLVRLYDVEDNVDDDEAKKILDLATKHAEHTGGDGAANLADNYLFGNPEAGLERNQEQAMRYFEIAIEDGNIRAMENLALLHIQGIGTAKNASKALELLEKAKDLGSVQAYNLLGYMHFNGAGVEKNLEKAVEYMEKAADMGSRESISNLGIAYLHGSGVKRSYAKAYKLFSTAAGLGHTPARFNQAYMVYEGLSVNASCDEALRMYQEVITKGSLVNYGNRAYAFYRNGDYIGAYLNYILAAALGFDEAIINLANMWEKNQTPFSCRKENLKCAATFYGLSALLFNSKYSFYKLGDIAYTQRDYKNALKLYENAKDYVGAAAFSVAYMKSIGLGTEIDIESAILSYEDIIYKSQAQYYDYLDQFPAYFGYYYLNIKKLII